MTIAAAIGRVSGMTRWTKPRSEFAPSTRAASNSSSGMPSTKLRVSSTANGTCSAASGRMTAQ